MKEVNTMEKKENLFSEPLLEYLNSINNEEGKTVIPKYSAEKLEAAIKESKKRAAIYVRDLGFDFDEAPRERTFDDDFKEWEDGEVIKQRDLPRKKGLISEETKENIKEYLDRIMALFLAASIALSAGTVGIIYLKHKNDPKPWELEKDDEIPVASSNFNPGVIITPTPVEKPVIPSSEVIIDENDEDLTTEDEFDGRED
jgi:hypothetical protein